MLLKGKPAVGRILCTAALAMLWLCSCAGNLSTPLQPVMLEVTGTQVIRIAVHSGSLKITEGAAGGKLEITGSQQSTESAELAVSTDAKGVTVQNPKGKGGFFGTEDIPVSLDIKVPAGRQVYLDLFDADVTIQNFHGNVDLKTLSGLSLIHI